MRPQSLLVTAGAAALFLGGSTLGRQFVDPPRPPPVLTTELRDDGHTGTLTLELEPRDHELAVIVESASAKRSRAVLGIELVDDRGVAVAKVERHSFALPAGSSNELTYALPDRLPDGYYAIRVTGALADGGQSEAQISHTYLEVRGGERHAIEMADWLNRSRALIAEVRR